MSNWIKPEKCDGPVVNLDGAWFVNKDFFGCPKIVFGNIGSSSSARENRDIEWSYENEEDRDHDYQRILDKLGLK